MTVAIARGKDKAPLAKQLGAHHYIDSSTENVAEALTALGGARVILATATSGKAMNATIGGLGLNGKLIMVGVSEEPVEVPITQFIMGRNSVQGWPSGTAADSQDTLAFSALLGCEADDRGISALARGRSLRPHDERQGALQGRADAGKVKRITVKQPDDRFESQR